MTRSDRAKISSWSAVLISALAVLIASITLGVQKYSSHTQDDKNERTAAVAASTSKCNKAFLKVYKDAQDARLPFADKQNAALIAAFKLVSRPGSSVASPAQIADLREKGQTFVDSAKEYEKAKKEHPYPSSTCPDVKGITVPK